MLRVKRHHTIYKLDMTCGETYGPLRHHITIRKIDMIYGET